MQRLGRASVSRRDRGVGPQRQCRVGAERVANIDGDTRLTGPIGGPTLMRYWLTIIPGIIAALLLSSVSTAATQQRVALIIGNAAYADLPLKNPVNDACAMAQRTRLRGHLLDSSGLAASRNDKRWIWSAMTTASKRVAVRPPPRRPRDYWWPTPLPVMLISEH